MQDSALPIWKISWRRQWQPSLVLLPGEWTEEPGGVQSVLSQESDTAAVAAKSLQSCPTLRPHRRQPTRLCHPWDSPGKNAGVGCHFLLQSRKVKSESEVAQSCLTLSDPMDCSLPGSSVHGIFQTRVLEWGAISFSGRCKSLGLLKSFL